MSQAIASLIGQSESLVAKAIKELEQLNGYPSHDARMLGENSHRLRQKLSQLNLDPDDTKAPELYHSLLAKFDNDSRHFDGVLGLGPDDSLTRRIDVAIELVDHIVRLPENWALKRSVARQILQASPPVKTMKRLRYRSLTSMLRREELSAIYLIAPYLESAAWRRAVAKQIAARDSIDYERRPVAIVNLPAIIGQGSAGPTWFVTSDQAMVSLAVWPSQGLAKAPVITIALLLLAASEELESRYQLATIGQLNPLFRWWADAGHLISSHQSKPVSLNLLDVALNHLNSTPFNGATIEEGARQFWSELNRRYALQPAVLSQPAPGYNFDSQTFKLKLPNTQLASDYVEI
jgi:hypothetical protein